MKKIVKISLIIIACGAVLGLGIGARALIGQQIEGARPIIDEQPVYAAEDGSDKPEETSDMLETEVTGKVLVEPIEPGMDLKRGSFITDEILFQLNELIVNETINGVLVRVSTVVHGDTRAFIRICLSLEGSEEKLMFGGPTRLDFPGGSSETFYVHNDIPDEEGAACEVLEFVGVVPSDEQGDWRFTMEDVMYPLPDEGTECEVYQKLTEADKNLQDAGITVACSTGEGMTSLEIVSKPAGLSEAEAQEMIMAVVRGHHHGPWQFELPMESGNVNPIN